MQYAKCFVVSEVQGEGNRESRVPAHRTGDLAFGASVEAPPPRFSNRNNCSLKLSEVEDCWSQHRSRQSGSILEKMPGVSVRMALIATSPLRSSLIVTPRHSSAPAKSRPNVFVLVTPNQISEARDHTWDTEFEVSLYRYLRYGKLGSKHHHR
jgi:hypothetical protein